MKKDYSKYKPNFMHSAKKEVKDVKVDISDKGISVTGVISPENNTPKEVSIGRTESLNVEVLKVEGRNIVEQNDQESPNDCTITKEVNPPESIKVYKTYTVKVKYLNVRAEPSVKSYKIQILRLGDKVTVTKYNDEWCEILDPLNMKKRAFVMTKHIS